MFVKTRFAPSSSGELHIGSMRTALYSWLFAKCHNGSFVLRIEDTDLKRSNKIFINNILKTLKWLGIIWDEGPYLQSERISIYKDKICEMLDLGYAYKCYCTSDRLQKMRINQIQLGKKPCYDRKCRNKKFLFNNTSEYVIRFKNPLMGKVVFNDLIRGNIIFNNVELDDLIIQRKNGIPTYNFCVVVDDLDMKITHVIRGEDHINNTPRQINILHALNANIPIYSHVSMIVDNQKSNLSKRKKSLSVLDYKKNGFLKEAVLNFLVKLGWSYGDREIFNIQEMKQLFSISGISRSSSEFNFKKLLWLNHYYLNNLSVDDNFIKIFKKHLNQENIIFDNGPDLLQIINILKSRCNTFREMAIQSYYFFYEVKNFNMSLITKYKFHNCIIILNIIYKKLLILERWNAKNIMKLFKSFAIQFNLALKNICMPFRIVITGQEQSPSINMIMEILGKKKSLERIKKVFLLFK